MASCERYRSTFLRPPSQKFDAAGRHGCPARKGEGGGHRRPMPEVALTAMLHCHPLFSARAGKAHNPRVSTELRMDRLIHDAFKPPKHLLEPYRVVLSRPVEDDDDMQCPPRYSSEAECRRDLFRSMIALIENGVDVNYQRRTGETVLLAAAFHRDTDMVRLLIHKYKADPLLAISKGDKALQDYMLTFFTDQITLLKEDVARATSEKEAVTASLRDQVQELESMAERLKSKVAELESRLEDEPEDIDTTLPEKLTLSEARSWLALALRDNERWRRISREKDLRIRELENPILGIKRRRR